MCKIIDFNRWRYILGIMRETGYIPRNSLHFLTHTNKTCTHLTHTNKTHTDTHAHLTYTNKMCNHLTHEPLTHTLFPDLRTLNTHTHTHIVSPLLVPLIRLQVASTDRLVWICWYCLRSKPPLVYPQIQATAVGASTRCKLLLVNSIIFCDYQKSSLYPRFYTTMMTVIFVFAFVFCF